MNEIWFQNTDTGSFSTHSIIPPSMLPFSKIPPLIHSWSVLYYDVDKWYSGFYLYKCSMQSIRWRFLQSKINSNGSKEPILQKGSIRAWKQWAKYGRQKRQGNFVSCMWKKPWKLSGAAGKACWLPAFTCNPGYSLSNNRLTVYY